MRHLIIVVPGLKSDPATWNPLREKLLKEPKLTGSVWCLWNHQAQQRPWKRANTLARELLAFITQEWNRCGRPEQIMLIGHSMGGILVRQAYLLASGTLPERTNREKWHNKVRHIILFAGTNRGFSPERHLTTMWLARIARYTGTNRYLPYSDFLSGSDFITNLRISWLRYFPTLGEDEPVIVQLLGDDDDIVALNDSIDVEQFPRAYQFTVVKAQHADLYRLDTLQPIDAKARYELIRDAILHPQELQEQPGQPEQRNRDLATDKIVVFILHGIRADNLGWVDTTEQKIKQRAKAQGIDVEVISKGYEYFSAFQFAVPLLRRLNIRWFQDEYGDALVRHPKARFHFIGHSNGTYTSRGTR
jgi:pimeloyl-ACP methyl ester carboxylesterase